MRLLSGSALVKGTFEQVDEEQAQLLKFGENRLGSLPIGCDVNRFQDGRGFSVKGGVGRIKEVRFVVWRNARE